MKKRLVLIDGHAIVYRAYYAFPPTLKTPEGEQVNAVYGFASILLNVIRELKPTHVVVAFDMDKPTFRHIEYASYKAQRPKTDQELKDQIGRVKEVVECLNIPIFGVNGFEADDVIGTLAKQSYDKKTEAVIVTGDQDAMQLVNGNVKVYVPARGKYPAKMYGEEQVKDRYGLEPKQIIDLKALMGDSSDNIPGVKGVGPKTATTLLQKYLTIERIYTGLDKALKSGDISAGVGKKLVDDYEEAVRSKRLATIVLDVPITLDLKACELHDYDKQKAVKFFHSMGFNSMIKRLPSDDWEQAAEEAFEVKDEPKEDKEKVEKKKDNQIGMF